MTDQQDDNQWPDPRREDSEASDQSSTGDAEICRSTAQPELSGEDGPRLLYEPRLVEMPGDRLEVRADRENPEIVPWGFWGGVLAAAVAGFVLLSGALTGAAIRYSITNVLVVAGLLLTGLVVFRVGRRTTLEETLVCELNLETGIVSWPTDEGTTPVAVTFQDIRELTFGLVEVPVGDSDSRTRLEAATLRIRDDRDRRLPIVEASTEKGETHGLARTLADLLELSINYEGTDVGEWADRSSSLPA